MQKLIWLNLCWAAKSFVYSEYEEITEGYFLVQGHIQGYSRDIGQQGLHRYWRRNVLVARFRRRILAMLVIKDVTNILAPTSSEAYVLK